jgi:hypothetical protein
MKVAIAHGCGYWIEGNWLRLKGTEGAKDNK